MRTFGHVRPDGKPSPVCARTVKELGSAFGCDWDKRLVFRFLAEDVIAMRPERSRGREVTVRAVDVYRFALLCKANCARLERARAIKARKAERLARARQERAERKLFGKETR